jgi:hypothetical protein
MRDPERNFDPGNPGTIGRLVVIALLAQDLVPLRELLPTYGSGVYAIYYVGEHPAYGEICRSETPIYVGKADPDEPTAATPRHQECVCSGVSPTIEQQSRKSNISRSQTDYRIDCQSMISTAAHRKHAETIKARGACYIPGVIGRWRAACAPG